MAHTKKFYIMKFSKMLVAATLAAVAMFSSCEDVKKGLEELGAAKVEVTPSEITFTSAEASSQDVQLLATRDWHVDANSLPDWIALSSIEGKASAEKITLTVSVLDNPNKDRSGDVTFSIGLATAVLKVTQKGEAGELKPGTGTVDDPYSVAAIIDYVNGLEDNVSSTEVFYVAGKVSSIQQSYTESGTYGNARFSISDDGTTAAEFIAYNCYYLNNKKFAAGDTDIQLGDDVIVCGTVVKYVGSKNQPTPEFTGGKCYLYQLNDKTSNPPAEETTAKPSGDGTKENPYNIAAAIAAVKGLSYTDTNNYEKIENIYVSGVISEIKSVDTGTYGNAEYSIVDEGYSAVFGVYRGYYLGGEKFTSADQIKVGDKVTIVGAICNMFGNTPQFTSGNSIVVLNGETAGGSEETPDYANAPAATVQEFITTGSADTYYKLTGTVSGFNSQYCSFDLTDETGTIVVWTVKNKEEWSSVIKNGGVVEVAGVYLYYNNTKHEVVDAYILSFKEGEPVEEDAPKGDGSLQSPFNAAGAVKCIKDGGDKETTEDYYVMGKISSIKYSFSTQYGTAQFTISEDGTTTSTQFTCYSVLFLNNKKWEEGQAQIEVGDDVIVYGKLTVYNGTYETASQKAYLYSLNGSTEDNTPMFGVKLTTIEVPASATEATINVTGNCAWTATSSNPAFTVSPASGEGAGTVTVSFAANTDSENAQTATITISTTAEAKTPSYEVTITQAKAGAVEKLELTFDFSQSNAGVPEGSKTDAIKAANPSGVEAAINGYSFFFGPNTGYHTGGKYLFLIQPAHLGLPVVEGKKLTKVVCTNTSGCSTSVKVGVFTDDAGATAVTGGEIQTWSKQSAEYTYTLSGTAAGTRYFICASNKNGQISKLVLTYE